jgi:two-component system chemotaxis sensor kinase CheA
MAENIFVDAFIDDYFSEAEEHLATVRRILLIVDQQSGRALEPARLQELLRALHTLKGLSGMVGLSAAEEAAHAMEDGLRAVPPEGAMPAALVEALFSGESFLETCIAARRANASIPSPGPYVDRMRDVLATLSRDNAGYQDPVPPGSSAIVTAQDVQARRFEFAASAALASRGIGVELVRRRLMELGDILSTVPRVRPDGGVVFEFTVAVRRSATPSESWREEGVSWDAWNDTPSQGVGLVVQQDPPPRASSSPPPMVATSSNVVRVDLGRLDDLMRMVGELVVSRAKLGQLIAQAGVHLPVALSDELGDANEEIERRLRTIREGVTRVRLVAVNEVFERMRFAMRDVVRDSRKSIYLEVQGQDTEIDKLVVDRMLEPLLHLVRNSASHGIESHHERVAAGKPADGTIWLRARAAGDRIILEVEDDGAGIDTEHVARRARQLGLVNSAETLGPDAILDVICSPGFSTRETADLTSGRGVGMGVVRSAIRSLGGELFVDSTLGAGTRFTIELPLTLMITDALIVEIGDQAMAIPQVALREIVPLETASVTRFENNEVLSFRGRVIPLVNLATLFHRESKPGIQRHVLIVGTAAQPTGLIVDRLVGLREIVVHPVSDPMVAVPGIAGATELADGRVSLILDAPTLVRLARERGHDRHALHAGSNDAARPIIIPEHAWS